MHLRGAQMSVRKDVDFLQQTPLFESVDLAQLQLLAFSAERLDLRRDAHLIRAGERSDSAYLILDGTAQAFASEDPAAEVVAELKPGAFLGELSMIAKLPHSISVKATSALVVIRIPHMLFMRVVAEFPDVGVRVLRALSEKLDHTVAELRHVQRFFDKVDSLAGS